MHKKGIQIERLCLCIVTHDNVYREEHNHIQSTAEMIPLMMRAVTDTRNIFHLLCEVAVQTKLSLALQLKKSVFHVSKF